MNQLTKVSWGAGQLGCFTVTALIGTQFLLFMTDYVGVAPAAAGSILALAKASDVGSDLLVGVLSDRFDSPWGRRRPWVLGGSLLLAVACGLVFNIDRVFSKAVLAAATVLMVLFYLGFTAVTVPLMAMSAEMTSGYQERTSIWIYAMVFSMTGTTLGTSLTPSLLQWFGGGRAAYHAAGWIMAVIPLAAGAVFFAGTAGVSGGPPAPKRRIPLGDWLRSLMGNRPFLALAMFKVMNYFAMSMLSISMTFYCIYVIRLGQQGIVIYGLTGLAGMLSGLALFAGLMQRGSKHVMCAVSSIFMGIMVLALRLQGPGAGAVLFGTTIYFLGIGTAGVMLMANAMVPDIVQWDMMRSGIRREGAVSSLISAIQKTMPALSTLTFGVLMTLGHYVPGRPTAAQSAGVIHMIYVGNCIIPGVLFFLAALPLLFFYDLTQQRLADHSAMLEPLIEPYSNTL